MRQILVQRGQIKVENVPAPLIERDHVLVEVAYSLISTGTELGAVTSSDESLVRLALAQPSRVKQVLDHLRSQGIHKTVARVREELDTGRPLGYSCSGVVIQTGQGVTHLQPGVRVACAGAGIANHAEIVLVPHNLAVGVPEGCSLRDAASMTLGSIALQGVRRANPALGEFVAVVGLGLLGQIVAQLLKAAGCRVLGFDLDPRRVEIARGQGMDLAFVPGEVDALAEVRHWTGNHGVDATIITAASPSDAIVQQAMEITRKKGRVVVVGDVGLGLKRSPFYEKEIDLLISCSYGPGRYDQRYERQGLDYPYAYVRWTEKRNMAEYLRLVSEGQVNLDPILEREYDLADAPAAYEELRTARDKPLGALLSYGLGDERLEQKLATKVTLKPFKPSGKVKVAVVGAGSFAKGVHLPNLQRLSELYHLRAIVSATGSNAKATAEQFGAEYATTDYQDVLDDGSVDMVLICTRHHLHAPMAIQAARAGKAVLMEKPMALNQEELERLLSALEDSGVPFTVGFNRRFSPVARRMKEIVARRQNPLMILYRVNAGYLPADHWVHGPEGGGRIIGEACHMFDLFNHLVEAQVEAVVAEPLRAQTEGASSSDNVSATVRYVDGSVCTLFYTSLGEPGVGKEYLEVYVDGKVLVADDFQSLQLYGLSGKGWRASVPDKGHRQMLESFARSLSGAEPWPIPMEQLVSATRVSFLVSGMNSVYAGK